MEKNNEHAMINEHYIPQAVILANGEYPAHELPLRLLAEAQFVVCCDGAAKRRRGSSCAGYSPLASMTAWGI